MRLIITENRKYAYSIAYAYTRDSKSDLETDKIMIGSDLSSFIWSNEPILKSGSIEPAFEKRLFEQIEALKVTKVTLALNPTRTSSLFASLLRASLEKKDIITEQVFLTTLWKKDVIAAFEGGAVEVTQNSAEQSMQTIPTRMKITRAVASAVREIAGNDFQSIDAGALALLALLSIREKNIGMGKYRIKASLRVEDKSLIASSTHCYSKDKATQLLKILDRNISYERYPYIPGIPTAETLYGIFDSCSLADIDLKEITESLYTKRYISCPYTMSDALPAKMNERDIKVLISNCIQIANPVEAIDVNNLDKAPRAAENMLHAIIPLISNAGRLSDNELTVYKFIAEKILDAARKSGTNSALFKDKSNGITFAAAIPEDLILTKRNARNILAVFSYKQCGTFSPYKPQELVKELTSRGLNAADVVYSILPAALKTETIFTDNLGVHLSPKGRKLFELLPANENETLSLYTFIEEAMLSCGSVNEIYSKVLNTLSGWKEKAAPVNQNPTHPARRNPLDEIEKSSKTPEKTTNPIDEEIAGDEPPGDLIPRQNDASRTETDEKEEPEKSPQECPEADLKDTPPALTDSDKNPAAGKEDIVLPCPFCKAQEMYIADAGFECRSCGKNLSRTMKTKKGLITLTEKDVKRLAQFGRTALKALYDGEKITDRAYVTITEGGKAALTHTSAYECAFCSSSLMSSEWGYYCEDCGFSVPFKIYNKRLTAEEIKTLISGDKTAVIHGLISKDGEIFDAALMATPKGIKLYRK